MEDERFNLGRITLRAEKSGGSCAGCFFYKNKDYSCSNQEIKELIKHCNWRVFKECPEIKKATNTVLKKQPLINAENMYRFTEWASTHYFYTYPEGWRADFDTSDEPKYITTKKLYEIWKTNR